MLDYATNHPNHDRLSDAGERSRTGAENYVE